jgi:hypothetical protein
MQFSEQIFKRILPWIAGVAILFGAGWYSHDYYNHYFEHLKLRRVHAKGLHFTSPLLDVELPEGMGVNYEPLPFKHKVDAYLKMQISSGLITEASVYYRDLLNGPGLGLTKTKSLIRPV